MFVHLGNDLMVPKKDIIAILDHNANVKIQGKSSQSIVTRSEKGKEKARVITAERVLLSTISSVTLKKRAESFL